MRDPVRVGVVGYGLGGSAFHAPLISVTPRLTLDAIVTADPQRRAAAAGRYPQARIERNVDDLLARADDLDLVVVTVPNAAHVAVATAALHAGCSVVVDKPVAPTAAEVEALGRVAVSAGLRLIPYHNRRWDGDFLTLEALLAEGRLGRVWRVESRFERWRPAPPAAPGWKQDTSQAGGGILYDLGPHLIDQMLVLFGAPTSVYAEMSGRTGALDDDAFVALRYADGLVAHLWASSTTAQPGPRFRLLGSSAAFVKFGLDPQENALRAGRLPTEADWGHEEPGAWGRLGTVEHSEPYRSRPGAYQEFYAAVAACLLDGAAPPVTPGDAAAGLRIIEAAHRSAAGAGVVGLS